MGNQQAGVLERKTQMLGLNAVFGDGQVWKHPTCTNYKVIYTSTTPELLQAKYDIAPTLFTTGVKPATVGNGKGRYANAKPMYRLASNVNKEFTYIKSVPKEQLFSKLTIEDFGLWYLDDGCFIKRSDNGSYRYYLCIGDCCNTPERKYLFENSLSNLFGSKYGSIQKNNSKATENNKTWLIPVDVATVILEEAKKYNVLDYKFPVTAPETIETGHKPRSRVGS